MKFTALEIPGVYLISLDLHKDNRGFFARSFCQREFCRHGLCTEFVQCDLSYNEKKGTLRGMHYQKYPYEEVKIVSCIQGAIYDVVLDIRKDSLTYGQWRAVKLTEKNHDMLYIPKGIAHGFQTLSDRSMIYYQMGQFYTPDAGCGIRFDDERFSIKWPIEDKIISGQDAMW